MRLPDTPSLSAFKSDATELLRDLRSGCPAAFKRVAAVRKIDADTVKRATCLRVLAREYGVTYEEIAAEERMISMYVQHCFTEGFWRQPSEGQFRRARFLLQFDALIESLQFQVPLAVAAKRRGVDFSGFHFSSLLFSRIDRVLDKKNVPDFSYLQAPGSLVHYDWMQDVSKFNNANFPSAKFYVITADPLVQPGSYGWRADFSHSDLRDVDFRGAYLRGARFVGAQVDGADFRNANINECIFTGAKGTYVSGGVRERNWDIGPRGVVREEVFG